MLLSVVFKITPNAHLYVVGRDFEEKSRPTRREVGKRPDLSDHYPPACHIQIMCALHKQQRTLVVSSGKSLNIQINFTKHKNNKCDFSQRVKIPYARSRVRSISK